MFLFVLYARCTTLFKGPSSLHHNPLLSLAQRALSPLTSSNVSLKPFKRRFLWGKLLADTAEKAIIDMTGAKA